MVNVYKLGGKIAENRYTQDALADAINMDRSTLNRKLKTGESFSVAQASALTKVLKMSQEDAIAIFFPHFVA